MQQDDPNRKIKLTFLSIVSNKPLKEAVKHQWMGRHKIQLHLYAMQRIWSQFDLKRAKFMTGNEWTLLYRRCSLVGVISQWNFRRLSIGIVTYREISLQISCSQSRQIHFEMLIACLFDLADNEGDAGLRIWRTMILCSCSFLSGVEIFSEKICNWKQKAIWKNFSNVILQHANS